MRLYLTLDILTFFQKIFLFTYKVIVLSSLPAAVKTSKFFLSLSLSLVNRSQAQMGKIAEKNCQKLVHLNFWRPPCFLQKYQFQNDSNWRKSKMIDRPKRKLIERKYYRTDVQIVVGIWRRLNKIVLRHLKCFTSLVTLFQGSSNLILS